MYIRIKLESIIEGHCHIKAYLIRNFHLAIVAVVVLKISHNHSHRTRFWDLLVTGTYPLPICPFITVTIEDRKIGISFCHKEKGWERWRVEVMMVMVVAVDSRPRTSLSQPTLSHFFRFLSTSVHFIPSYYQRKGCFTITRCFTKSSSSRINQTRDFYLFACDTQWLHSVQDDYTFCRTWYHSSHIIQHIRVFAADKSRWKVPVDGLSGFLRICEGPTKTAGWVKNPSSAGLSGR